MNESDASTWEAPHDTSSTPEATGVRPYAHPYYWAAFILIGDPD
jgi:CHAT domain-containing protein